MDSKVRLTSMLINFLKFFYYNFNVHFLAPQNELFKNNSVRIGTPHFYACVKFPLFTERHAMKEFRLKGVRESHFAD